MSVYNYLNKESVLSLIKLALLEDIGDGDHTSLASIPADKINSSKLIVKDEGILAGVESAKWVCEAVDSNLIFNELISDGSNVKYGDIAFTVEGNSRSILAAERLLLNIMQRMSGIATYTNFLVQKVAHTNVRLLDTRKTTPNFRIFEKWAVQIGGGVNHRFGLFDMILLKDNHVDVAGGIFNALTNTKNYLERTGLKLDIEIEVRNIQELSQVVEFGGVKRIMFDNMAVQEICKGLEIINGQFETEISGGVSEETIVQLAETGVDYISIGKLTHSIRSLDLSLKAIK
ncbi:MAG: carboxylating nicotinate-nucleotide diphosphorylase [Opitutaceae bacterium]|nr:carboxylating nicotinate-nucleotide diphosphorylase [Cytophagales bacterium]